MISECGAAGGIRTGGEIRRKCAPVPFCTPQIPYDLIWVQTLVVAVGSGFESKDYNIVGHEERTIHVPNSE
jgi:hypothetical protein